MSEIARQVVGLALTLAGMVGCAYGEVAEGALFFIAAGVWANGGGK